MSSKDNEKIYVRILDVEVPLEDFTIDLLKKDDLKIIMNWELGGITDPLGQLISWLYDNVVGWFKKIYSDLSTFFHSIIDEAIGTLKDWISDVKGFVNTIYSYLSSAISKVISTISSTIQDIYNSIVSSISSAVNTISSAVSGIVDTVVSKVKGFFDSIWTSIQNALKPISDVLSKVWSWVYEGISKITGTLATVYGYIKSGFETLWDTLKGIGAYIVAKIQPYISGAIEAFKKGFAEVASFFKELYNHLVQGVNYISDKIMGFVNAILRFPEWFPNWFREHISKPISDAVSSLASWLWEKMPESVKTFFERAKDVFVGLYENLKEFFANPKEWIVEHVWDPLKERLKDIGEWIWEKLPEDIKDFFTKVKDVFTGFYEGLKGFFEDPKGWITTHVLDPLREKLQEFAEWVWERVPDTLKSAIESFQNFIKSIWESLKAFIENPSEFMKTHIVSPFIDAISGLKDTIFEHVKSGLEKLYEWGQTVWSAIVSGFDWVVDNVFAPIARKIWGFGVKVAGALSTVVSPILLGLSTVVKSSIDAIHSVTLPHVELGSPEGTFPLLLASMTSNISKATLPAQFSAFASMVAGDAGETEVQVAGTKVKLRTQALKMLGLELLRSVVMSHVFPLFWATSRYVDISFRQFMADHTWITIPSPEIAIEMMNRGLIDAETLKWMVRAGGYNISFVDNILSTKSITIETRASRMFNLRDAPFVILGLRFWLPSVSDLCRFMLKDVFLKPEDFIKVMAIKGVPPHLAWAYYLLHFRYPSMPDLWEFYCRVLAHEWLQQHGSTIKEMLWLPELIETKVNTKDVAYALTKYAKWQDYSDISWFKGDAKAGTMQNVSDNMIVRELMADIPTRIDARWMYKWGIITDYELKGIALARGMHPKWVDLITKGEAMNALSEERTYARTGVLNLFEYGLLTEGAVDKLLSELTKVNILGEDVPVKFLEGERKLLILRHKLDRAYDIVRGLLSNITYMINENVMSINEGIGMIKEFGKNIADKLKVPVDIDEGFLNVYLSAQTARKKLETVRRIRSWMWTFLYRIVELAEAGVKTLAEVNAEIDAYATKAFLTDEEKALMKALAKIAYDAYKWRRSLSIEYKSIISKFKKGLISYSKALSQLMALGYSREEAEALLDAEKYSYVTYPSTIATLAEVYPKARELLDEFLRTHHMSAKEVEAWRAYIMLKPIKDEVSRLVTEILSDYAEGILTDEDLNTIFNMLKEKFFYEDEEVEILRTIAKLRRTRYMARRGGGG